jgi:predicted metal-dependent hydrolase
VISNHNGGRSIHVHLPPFYGDFIAKNMIKNRAKNITKTLSKTPLKTWPILED